MATIANVRAWRAAALEEIFTATKSRATCS